MRIGDPTMRRETIVGVLREHPLSSAAEVSAILLEETGGRPALLTGAIYIPPYAVYADLRKLEDDGKVIRWQTPEVRSISWQLA